MADKLKVILSNSEYEVFNKSFLQSEAVDSSKEEDFRTLVGKLQKQYNSDAQGTKELYVINGKNTKQVYSPPAGLGNIKYVYTELNQKLINFLVAIEQKKSEEYAKESLRKQVELENKEKEKEAARIAQQEREQTKKDTAVEVAKAEKRLNEVVETLSKYKNDDGSRKILPIFRKSYSTLSSYTPQINCTVDYFYGKSETDGTKRNVASLNLFDVPYNYIKSLKLLQKGGSPEATELTLTLEEPGGNVSAALMSFLFLISLNGPQGNNFLPIVNLSFGWGGSERQVVVEKNKPSVHKSVLEQSYSVNKANVSFEGTKQKVTLICSLFLNEALETKNKNSTPYNVFGNNITYFLVRNRLYWYNKKEGLRTVGIPVTAKFPTSVEIKTDGSSLGASGVSWLSWFSKIESKLLFFFKFGLAKNNYFNLNVEKSKEAIDSEISSYLDRPLHPYVVFCCVLNNFLLNFGNNSITVFPAFEEKDIIDNENFLRPSLSSTMDYGQYLRDVVNNGGRNDYKSKLNGGPILAKDTTVSPNDSWLKLLQTFSGAVKLKIKNVEHQLSISFIKVSPKNVTEIQNFITKSITGQKVSSLGSYVLFVAPQSLNFSLLTKPVQSYTVFPKTKVESRPNKSYFNSGSKNINDGAFPDVISFQPQLDLYSTISTAISEKNYIPTTNEGDAEKQWYFSKETIKEKKEDLVDYIKNFYSKVSQPKESVVLNKSGNFWKETSSDKEMFFKSLQSVSDTKVSFSKDKNNNYVFTTSDKTTISLNKLALDMEKEWLYLNTTNLGEQINQLFSKIKKVSINEPSSVEYASFVTKNRDFFRRLKDVGFTFEADLKILGEPAFSNYNLFSGEFMKIALRVNNQDGSENVLLSGLYLVTEVTQEIEGGHFTTTLKLRYDSAYYIN